MGGPCGGSCGHHPGERSWHPEPGQASKETGVEGDQVRQELSGCVAGRGGGLRDLSALWEHAVNTGTLGLSPAQHGSVASAVFS